MENKKKWREMNNIQISPCLFCLDSLISKEISILIPCGHVFHSECIELWRKQKKKNCIECKTIFKNIIKIYGLVDNYSIFIDKLQFRL